MTKRKILIVDDESIGRQLLQAILLIEGFETFLAENGEDAIQKASQVKPDLILLDVMMPYMNGYEVTKAIRADSELKDIPIILVSALEDRNSKLQGLDIGANQYVSKPFNKTELLKVIRSLIPSE